jgi:hypothetical protein
VVAADQHHLRGARRGDAGEEAVEAGLGLSARRDLVEDVARDDQGVDLLVGEHAEQPGEEAVVIGAQADAAQLQAEVPVGGVEDAHLCT